MSILELCHCRPDYRLSEVRRTSIGTASSTIQQGGLVELTTDGDDEEQNGRTTSNNYKRVKETITILGVI
jgi:hypothetical protein